MVGVLDQGGDCELDGGLPPGWRAVATFDSGSPGVRELEVAAPARLRRYCSYTWTKAGPAEPAYVALRAAIDAYPHMSAASTSPDCQAGRAQAGPTQSTEAELRVAAAQHEAFRLDIGWVSPDQLAPAALDRELVAIAVADTISPAVAADPELEPAYNHGEVVAAIIADVACPGGSIECRASLRPILAMPRRDAIGEADWIGGGDKATRTDVALAVYEAVARWRQRRSEDPEAPRRLIINLSLGWPARLDDTLAPVRALRDALSYAACNGALVFAAAGNDNGPRSQRRAFGPLEPARFEATPAPDAAACEALGFSAPAGAEDEIFTAKERPLVYAVAGVDGQDRALLNGRRGARPSLAAPAMDGLARGFDGDLTRALTGSSIAVAVVSGAAALIWSHRPELRPDEVVELLHASGWPLDARADFGLGAREPIHRVHVCAALAQACANREERSCPKLDCRATAPAGREHRRDLAEALRALHRGQRRGRVEASAKR